jgi:two-component system chemotaxis sensor kinase CheA
LVAFRFDSFSGTSTGYYSRYRMINQFNDDLINELFSAVHTIKGSAGIFGFDDVVSFTHVAESVMGMLRDKELTLDENLGSLLLDSRDQISDLVKHVIESSDRPLADDTRQQGDKLLGQLQQYLDGENHGDNPSSKISVETESSSVKNQIHFMLTSEPV